MKWKKKLWNEGYKNEMKDKVWNQRLKYEMKVGDEMKV